LEPPTGSECWRWQAEETRAGLDFFMTEPIFEETFIGCMTVFFFFFITCSNALIISLLNLLPIEREALETEPKESATGRISTLRAS
jgi:hypothetical protein